MNFESYAQRIRSLPDYGMKTKKPKNSFQKCFQAKNPIMKITSINNAKFVGLSNKQ